MASGSFTYHDSAILYMMIDTYMAADIILIMKIMAMMPKKNVMMRRRVLEIRCMVVMIAMTDGDIRI